MFSVTFLMEIPSQLRSSLDASQQWSEAWADHQPFIKVRWWCHWTCQAEAIAQWDLIYHEMIAVKNMHREYTGVNESTSEALQHHVSQATTNRQGDTSKKMVKFIEERGSLFSADCPTKLHNFVTKQVISEEIRKDVLNASKKDKKKYQAFHNESIIDKTVQLRNTIHGENLKTMISIKDKPSKQPRKVSESLISLTSQLK